MKKNLIVLLLVVCMSIAGSLIVHENSGASTADIYNQFEQNSVADSYSTVEKDGQYLGKKLLVSNDIGQCMGECASEQGICISGCQGNPQCIANCAAAHGRCVARCN
jgi:hypothetical protein